MKSIGKSRGQASVEFTIFSVILVILMLIPVQLAWMGIQKWQFTHFASSAARTWTVHKDQSPTAAMGLVTGRSLIRGWPLFSQQRYIAIIIASTGTKEIEKGVGGDINTEGLSFNGLGRVIPIFQPFFGLSGPWGGGGFENLDTRLFISATGFNRFEGYIPMQREPTEEPGEQRDNDCNETPCESGNTR